MIVLRDVWMIYVGIKRYRDYLLHPLRRKAGVVGARGMSLEVKAGECVGLLGTNGAGKTTLLKLMGGLLYPTRGTVTVNEYDTRTQNLQARQAVGYVLNEERSFYWRLTGVQNLEFFGALDNLGGNGLRNRIAELVDLVGLSAAANWRVADYSSGMRQRLAIARGLLSDPQVLLLDEPTKSLDPAGAEELRQLISREIQGRGRKTVIVSTHMLDEVRAMCDRVCVIKQGTLAASRAIGPDEREEDLMRFYRWALSRADATERDRDGCGSGTGRGEAMDTVGSGVGR